MVFCNASVMHEVQHGVVKCQVFGFDLRSHKYLAKFNRSAMKGFCNNLQKQRNNQLVPLNVGEITH